VERLREARELPLFVGTTCVTTDLSGGPGAPGRGWLLWGRRSETRPFFQPLDEADVATLESVAGFLGSALSNQGLFRRVKAQADAFARFVPREFLLCLGRTEVADVRLGDHVRREMTVLFADIRDFTTWSEGMTPEENFDFLNGYLGHVGPAVVEHKGFVDKYVGDGIMALFPGSPDDAVGAAVAMHARLDAFNRARRAGGAPRGGGERDVRIGVGLHTGALILGTIGFADRMDSTVVADAVNVAARLEGLTKLCGARILASGDTLARLSPEARARLPHRPVGRVRLRGKDRPVEVLEVLAADPPGLVEMKLRGQARLADGLDAFAAGRFAEARAIFADLSPDDPLRSLYVARCESQERRGAPEGWDGGQTLDAG
jgi:two-component system sensor histidine kinase ChiS